MIDHSEVALTAEVKGQTIEFLPLRGIDLFRLINWANGRHREEALRLIPTASVEEKVELFRATANRYTEDDLGELLNDPEVYYEALWRCYARANADAERDRFDALFGPLDAALIAELFNLVSGYGGEGEDPTQAAARQKAKSGATAKPSPPPASTTT